MSWKAVPIRGVRRRDCCQIRLRRLTLAGEQESNMNRPDAIFLAVISCAIFFGWVYYWPH